MDIITKPLTPIIGFLVTATFGFWLSKIGKPYNGILFNIHRLIALGTVIVTSIQVYKTLKVLEPQSLLIISIAVAVIGVVALFASGGAAVRDDSRRLLVELLQCRRGVPRDAVLRP